MVTSEKRGDSDETQEADSPQPLTLPDANADSCDRCLCAPCVLDETSRQSWWLSTNSQEKRTINTMRKILYNIV